MSLYSKLSNQVLYNEDPCVATQDKETELSQYSIPLLDYPDMNIALGKKCTAFEKNGIMVHWCYLLYGNGAKKIGLFEFPKHRYESYLEHDNPDEIMESKLLPHLLLFSDAREHVLKAKQEQNAELMYSEKPDYSIVSWGLPHETDSFDIHMFQSDTPLKDGTKSTSKDMSYLLGIEGIKVDSKETTLIETLSTALSPMVHKTKEETKQYLHGILSDHVTEDVFTTLTTMQEMIVDEIKSLKQSSRDLRQHIQKGKASVKQIHHNEELNEFLTTINDTKSNLQSQTTKLKNLQKLLTFSQDLSKISDVRLFKQSIADTSYVPEPWSIPILERLMNVKIILLSPDIPNYLVTRRQSPFPMKEMLFNPKYYVMMQFNENKYNLIQYNDQSLSTFTELPHKIKDLVVLRCMERNAGIYSYIPMFEKFKQFSMSAQQKQEQETWLQTHATEEHIEETTLLIHPDINGTWLPGDVLSEMILYDELLDWGMQLYQKEWRHKLDNHYGGKDGYFTLEDKQWTSVNHYVAAMKIKSVDEVKFHKLSRTSKSGLSKLPIPTDYTRMDLVYTAQFAKFSQNEGLKQLLLNTSNSKLYAYLPGQPPILLSSLMKARDLLHA